MQDPSLYTQMNPTFPEPEHLKCPRCDSPNTKFCYYNNYNLSQPRHFCKSCKRYWTKGGSLRNIPVGGASRKNTKRSATKKPSSSSSPPPPPPLPPPPPPKAASEASETGGPGLDLGQFGNFNNGLSLEGSNLQLREFDSVQNPGSFLGSGQTRIIEPQVGLQNGDEDNSSCWNGDNEWAELTIYPPGSSYL